LIDPRTYVLLSRHLSTHFLQMRCWLRELEEENAQLKRIVEMDSGVPDFKRGLSQDRAGTELWSDHLDHGPTLVVVVRT
jgi:hypothetical protein